MCSVTKAGYPCVYVLIYGNYYDLGVNGVISSMSAENFIKEYMDYNFEYNDIQFEQPEQLNKEVPQFDEHFVEQIKQIDGVENVDIQKTVWAGIDFDETALEGFMKIQYEDSRYKSKGSPMNNDRGT